MLEADRAPSAVALTRAVAEAVTVARDVGVGWCAARHLTHTGAIGYFALQAAEAGFAGIVMSASGPMMIYPGSRVAAVSSNPIAFAIPRKGGQPYLLDFSTGVVANGKIMGAADRGEAIPTGWGVDKDGRDTTDPKKVENVLPMAGIKGAGLSFMIECLTSLLLSEPRIAPDLESWAIGDDPFLNGSVIAIDPGAFGDRDRFLREAERLGTAIAGLARAEGVKKIMLPGERGDAIRAEREATGIPIPKGTWQRIVKAAEAAGRHAADVSGGEERRDEALRSRPSRLRAAAGRSLVGPGVHPAPADPPRLPRFGRRKLRRFRTRRHRSATGRSQQRSPCWGRRDVAALPPSRD